MELSTFIAATVVAHISFAAFVSAHAFMNDREAGNWPYLTLAFGLAGVAGYFFYEQESAQV